MSKPLQMNRPEPSVAPGVKVVNRDERAKLLEAAEIIEAAKARAAEIERKAEEAYKARYEAGYADGLEAGRLENMEKVMETAMASVEFIEGIEGTVVDVVMQSVRKILGEMNREDRIRAIVKTALANVRGQQKVTVRVAPSDEPVVSEALAAQTAGSFLTVVADARLEPDSCILESDLGVINASLSTQLKALEHAFSAKIRQ